MTPTICTKSIDSSDNSLQVAELSGHPDLQIVVNTYLQTVSSTAFRIRVSLQRLSWLITHQSRNDPRIPCDHGYACCSQACNLTGRGVSYLCNRCSGWVHSKCSGLQNSAEYRRVKDWVCSSFSSPPTLPNPQPLPTSMATQDVDGYSFTIVQFNANGIGNKLTELAEFLKRHNVKVAVLHESKLSPKSKSPSIQNFTTVRKDRRQGQGGGLLTLIHRSINFSR